MRVGRNGSRRSEAFHCPPGLSDLVTVEKIRGLNRLARSRTERPDAPLHLDLERRVEERQPKSRTGWWALVM